MTYKEKIAKERPDMLDVKRFGGVTGCPGRYFAGAAEYCGKSSPKNCSLCWNTEIPGTESASSKPETTLDLLSKAIEQKDKSVNICVHPDGTISVSIFPFSEEEDEEDDFVPFQETMMSVLGDMTTAQAEYAIKYLREKINVNDGWREVTYSHDKHGKRIITKNEPPEYTIVNVYCPEKKRVFAAFWSRLNGRWTLAGWSDITDEPSKAELRTHVSHWMPVPNGPEVG
jgi:hypothetical protein